MAQKRIDSSLLSVFRLFIGIRLVYSLALLAANQWAAPRFLREQPGSLISFISVAETSFLLVYLSWPLLERRLGKFYLPLALFIATVGPIVENSLAFVSSVTDIILLMVPVILIAWRYPFRVLVGYLIALAALDIVLYPVTGISLEVRMSMVVGMLVFRTLVLILVGFVVNRLSLEQRVQNSRLEQANQQLASAANTLEQLTISRERNRMARELHDTLAHSLSAVAVQLEAASALWEADSKQAHEMLERSLALTRTGLNEARRAIQALRIAPLEDLGLNLALRNLAYSEAERGGYHLDLQLPEEMPRLAPDTEYGVYRIAEEALRNVAWHANAKNVHVSLSFSDHRLDMIIQDDGCGFVYDPQMQSEHFGLRGMRERAEGLGGKLSVESQPDKGTVIGLEVEIDHGESLDL